MLNKYFPYVLVGLLAFTGCAKKVKEVTKNPIHFEHTTREVPATPAITIFVHGTQSFIKYIPIQFLHQLTECTPGLHKALGQQCIYLNVAEYINASDPKIFDIDHFYLFGWPGTLSFEEREHQAHILFEQLNELVARYQQAYGQTPQIRIITHSHGGNIALHLAKIKPEPMWHVDQLIMMGCPVQDETKHLAASPLFKNAYSLYSRDDMIQVADMQGLYNKNATSLMSGRIFPASPNLSQVKLKIDGRSVGHMEVILPHFLKQLGSIIDEIDLWRAQKPEQWRTNDTKKHVLAMSHLKPLLPPAKHKNYYRRTMKLIEC
jgi:hypothetical protein